MNVFAIHPFALHVMGLSRHGVGIRALAEHGLLRRVYSDVTIENPAAI